MIQEPVKIKRALISVSDKAHLDKLVMALHEMNVEIISTGGTAKFIQDMNIPVTPIDQVTGNPEAFGGRMKSISFQVTSGLLFRRHHATDLEEAKKLNITPIDLVICNLYPFHNYSGKNSNQFGEDILIENIDIGGPLMIRASAKNYESVAVLSDPSEYDHFLDHIAKSAGHTSFEYRRKLAVNTFTRIAQYDQMIATELTNRFDPEEKAALPYIALSAKEKLRYGENPHQNAHLFKIENTTSSKSLVEALFLQGKELSYNNWIDADAAWRVMSDTYHAQKSTQLNYVTSVIKHANPCGLAASKSAFSSLMDAWNGDNISSFGGIIACSYKVEKDVAQFLTSNFIEVVLAPDFTPEALECFSKKKNVRLLKVDIREYEQKEFILKSISGGVLIQDEDERSLKPELSEVVTTSKFNKDQMELVDFGVIACKHLKSNGIALVTKTQEGNFILAGTGMGQPNRLDSLKLLASPRAQKKNMLMQDMILISDAFFPFSDSIDVCHEVGIKYIVQPGGSIKDQEVIDACNKFNISMLMTKTRHFRH